MLPPWRRVAATCACRQARLARFEETGKAAEHCRASSGAVPELSAPPEKPGAAQHGPPGPRSRPSLGRQRCKPDGLAWKARRVTRRAARVSTGSSGLSHRLFNKTFFKQLQEDLLLWLHGFAASTNEPCPHLPVSIRAGTSHELVPKQRTAWGQEPKLLASTTNQDEPYCMVFAA